MRSALTLKFFDMTKQDLIFLDTETTGTGPEDRLCQVAYSFAGSEYEGLFRPPIPISLDAMVVTRITNRMVEECPSFSGSVMHRNLEQIFADDIRLHTGTAAERSLQLVEEIRATCESAS